ncbi:putative nuclease HARBI1 [Pleurodeles waltl]|uniref:putative nuclease HARBI1 n=1 Tax=Pleurodeles waltl TaxID=8319 RepID=UPI003709897B
MAYVKVDFDQMEQIPYVVGAIDITDVSLVPPTVNEQVYGNRKTYHSINVQVVCLANQYLSQVTAKFPGSVHDSYIMWNSNVPHIMVRLHTERAWLVDDSGYPNLPWLLTPAKYPATPGELHFNEAHGRTRRVIERTFGLLKARFKCLDLSGGALLYSPHKVCQITVARCMHHNQALRHQIPLLADGGEAAVLLATHGDMESDEEPEEEGAAECRTELINRYFQ